MEGEASFAPRALSLSLLFFYSTLFSVFAIEASERTCRVPFSFDADAAASCVALHFREFALLTVYVWNERAREGLAFC